MKLIPSLFIKTLGPVWNTGMKNGGTGKNTGIGCSEK
jgi:hypothetical protein